MFVLAQTLCRMSFLSRFVTGTDEIYILFLRCNTAAVCSEFQQLIFFLDINAPIRGKIKICSLKLSVHKLHFSLC